MMPFYFTLLQYSLDAPLTAFSCLYNPCWNSGIASPHKQCLWWILQDCSILGQSCSIHHSHSLVSSCFSVPKLSAHQNYSQTFSGPQDCKSLLASYWASYIITNATIRWEVICHSLPIKYIDTAAVVPLDSRKFLAIDSNSKIHLDEFLMPQVSRTYSN